MPFLKKHSTELPRSRKQEEITRKNGLRHLIFAVNKDTYRGEWKNDKKNGKGVAKVNMNKKLYEGDFVNNVKHGFGVGATKVPGIDVYKLYYVGDWVNGKMEGYGRWISKQGLYLGNFKNNKRDGYGTMWYRDGYYYEGEWTNGKKQGWGMLVHTNGNRYEGHYLDGKKHGKGRFYFINVGQLQEGVWYDDVCIFSVMYNLPYRQAAKQPTAFPLPPLHLVDPEGVCAEQEYRALEGVLEECLGDYENDSFGSYESYQ